MALVDEVIQLRTDSLNALDSAHDSFDHTKQAWRLVQQMVSQGHSVTMRNQATGATVTEKQLPGLAQRYVTGYLASATFQQFVSVFESFVFDLLRAWLTEYPAHLSGKQVPFQTVLDSPENERSFVPQSLEVSPILSIGE